MAQVQDRSDAAHAGKRSPNQHSAELQEAKRREKMQAHGSSHRTAGTARPDEAKDAPH